MEHRDSYGRIDKIRCHPLFTACMEQIREAERERLFCGHGMEHLKDVARIAWILNLEEKAGLDRETVYAAALLHYCGRAEQYSRGEDHAAAGARMAAGILPACGFDREETSRICAAILAHRQSGRQEGRGVLGGILYRADKLSRSCFSCPAQAVCNWPEEQKNLTFLI